VSFEVDVKEHHLGLMLAGQREALFGARGFEDRPALRRQRDSRGGAQTGVVVRDEDGRGVAASSSAERAETYVVGLRATTAPLLALLNEWSSEPLVAYRLERYAQVFGGHDVASIAGSAAQVGDRVVRNAGSSMLKRHSASKRRRVAKSSGLVFLAAPAKKEHPGSRDRRAEKHPGLRGRRCRWQGHDAEKVHRVSIGVRARASRRRCAG
jgi:hypothetical protein